MGRRPLPRRYSPYIQKPDRVESAKFKQIKKDVKRRDKCVCTLCDKYRKGGEVHHIRNWANNARLRYDEKNCCWVCYRCHNKYLKGNEDSYIVILSEKVRKKYE
jgi:5-methylcytosine-specific restriction endonuclease McrA